MVDLMATYLLLGRTTRVVWQPWLTLFITFNAGEIIPKRLALILSHFNDLVRTKNAAASTREPDSSLVNLMWTYELL